jgi:hypothetical protein
MTSAFRGSDAAIVAFLSAVVAQATSQTRPALPNMGALFIGDISTRGLKSHSYSIADLGRPAMNQPRPNDTTPQDGGATP